MFQEEYFFKLTLRDGIAKGKLKAIRGKVTGGGSVDDHNCWLTETILVRSDWLVKHSVHRGSDSC